MTVDELIEAAEALRHQIGGNSTVVVQHCDGTLRVLQSAKADDTCAQIGPRRYVRTEAGTEGRRHAGKVALLRSWSR